MSWWMHFMNIFLMFSLNSWWIPDEKLPGILFLNPHLLDIRNVKRWGLVYTQLHHNLIWKEPMSHLKHKHNFKYPTFILPLSPSTEADRAVKFGAWISWPSQYLYILIFIIGLSVSNRWITYFSWYLSWEFKGQCSKQYFLAILVHLAIRNTVYWIIGSFTFG